MQKAKNILRALMLPAIIFFYGCGALGPHTKPFTPATLGYVTSIHKDLISLPPPKGKIVVAVYNFRDQSGQYKYHPTSTSFSTAVTQGATSMLVQALKESGWFTPVEREGFNNLLTERKIIRAKLKGNGGKSIPTLLHAPLLLEGGIIAYETNVVTGGLGAKYFGIGGSTKFRKDQVAIYLRAVNVNSGEVIQSTSTTKTILSYEVDVGVFRFVSFARLFEMEMGVTQNEPPQLAVLEAIEKALFVLIVEGVLNGNWELKNLEDINNPIFLSYLEERGEENPAATILAFLKQREKPPQGISDGVLEQKKLFLEDLKKQQEKKE